MRWILTYLKTAGDNFHTVVDGVLYRSATPSPENLEKWQRKYKIATWLDLRIPTTAALTAGTQTLAGNAFANSIGRPNITNPAGGTEAGVWVPPALDYLPVANGEHPIVLAQNEGVVIRNRAGWPAAGTGTIAVEIAWAEVNAY